MRTAAGRVIRRGIVALALLATLPGAPVAAGQTFDEAVAAYDRGDYVTAVRGFLVHAEQGDATAQYKLGVMYNYGWGVPEDHAEAVKWYRKAAEQGDADAQFNLGVMHAAGEGVLKDEAEAVRWFRLAAEQVHQSVAIPDEGLSEEELEALFATMPGSPSLAKSVTIPASVTIPDEGFVAKDES